MKKILLLIVCLLLLGCSRDMPEVEKDILITDEAKALANELRVDFNNLDLDVNVIDSTGSNFSLYLLRVVADEEVPSDYKKLCSFIKTFTKKNKIYDFYKPDNEFSEEDINEQTKKILLKAIIKSKDYKITINRINGISFRGSEQTYSMYKINLLEHDFDNK